MSMNEKKVSRVRRAQRARAKIRELRAEWDPKLREMMDEIVGRGR